MHEYILFGVFFIGLGILQLGWGVAVILAGPNGTLRLTGLLNVGVVLLWIVSRTVGLPLGQHPGQPEPFGLPAMAATVFELTLVASLIRQQLRHRPTRPPQRVLGYIAWLLPAATIGLTVLAVLQATNPTHAAH